MPNSRHHLIVSQLVRLLTLPLFLLLSACLSPITPTAPPAAPEIVAGVTNANLGPATATVPAIVVIKYNSWQKKHPPYASTFTWGWLEDALVGNPYAFQLRINYDFLGSAFSVLDANGVALGSVAARSNTSHSCTAANGQAIPNSECYWSPGNNLYISPAPVPPGAGVYTVSLVNTCADVITPSLTAYATADRAAHCASGQVGGATVLLTISTARSLTPNVKVRYTLVAKNSAGSANTPFDVMYQPPPAYIPPFIISGTTSPGTPNMPPATQCPGLPNGLAQSFSFQRTCVHGGSSATDTVAGTGCTRSEARQQLLQIYAIELTQGCVLGQ